MTKEQYLLIQLADECVEVAQRCHKALHFGLDEVQEGQSQSNLDRLIQELHDVQGTLEFMRKIKMLPANMRNETSVERKMDKIRKYMGYSRSLKILEN